MTRQVVVDEKTAKQAEKDYEAELDREVKARIEQETNDSHMDAAAKTALEAAQKDAREAKTRAEAAETKQADFEKRMKALEECSADQKRVEADEKKSFDAETLRRAKLRAEVTVPADRVEAESARLSKMGREAVDELLRATPAPSADDLVLGTRTEAKKDSKKDHIKVIRTEEGGEAFAVADWSHYDPAANTASRGVLA